MTSVGRCAARMTLAMEKVFPEPVTPTNVWCLAPESSPSVSLAMA